MKRMRDYSRWSLERLEQQAEHYRAVLAGNREALRPHRATRIVLEEIEKQIALKRATQ